MELNGAAVTTEISDRQLADNDPLVARNGRCCQLYRLQPTETKTPLGKTGTVNLTADNTATAVVANQQFTGSDVYQLDFTFANIKLEVPANQGMSGQQYQAAVTWNLVTGP
ncbi:TPA: WxL domain-containing protein [Enterococcus faecalis]|nr:WxL domain-containing protein [Enterococcus faecalis]